MIMGGGTGNLQIKQTLLSWKGDFRSIENIQILKSCDVVVTNPPFSLFQDYVEQLISFKKKFLIIGNLNFVSTIYGFSLLHSNQIRFGVTKVSKFMLPDNTMINLGFCYWYTNLPVKISHKKLELTKHYNEKDYPKYDNYNAIEVSKVADIPCDYDGVVGVPINIMFYDLEDYKVLGCSNRINLKLNGKLTYKRVFIKSECKPHG